MEFTRDYGFNAGPHTYGVPQVWVGHSCYDIELEIGDYTSISQEVMLLFNSSHLHYLTLYPAIVGLDMHPCHPKKVYIGNDCLIGFRTLIIEGSYISDGCIIGAGSVVRGYIPPYSICFGNPCIVQRYRYKPDQIDKMMKIKWWNWDEEKIHGALDLLYSDNIDEFINKYYTE